MTAQDLEGAPKMAPSMDIGAHLLIVDDDERIRMLLQKFLMRNGFMASGARDAAHARKLLDGLSFDMIVLDVMMPGEDGLSLCRHIRADRATPILLLTAKGEAEDQCDPASDAGTG